MLTRATVWLALVGSLLGMAAAPDTDEAQQLLAARYVVGFHEFPAGLAIGGSYLGEPIVDLDQVLRFVSVETDDPAGFAQQASSDPNVRYTEESEPIQFLTPVAPVGTLPYDPRTLLEDGLESVAFSSNDPLLGSQYGPQQVRGPAAWDYKRGSTTAAVCIVDTGIRRSHEDIGTGRWKGWHDFVNGRSTPYDDRGHGTHVAGIAAAGLHNGTGIAGMGNVGIYGVKVLDATGFGYWTTIAKGIRWCADNTISRTVINLSIGGSGWNQSMADAVAYAYGRGRLIVASSGNDACSGCAHYPSDYGEVISVGCTDGARTVCGFSNRSPRLELAAPGYDILSTYSSHNSSYAYMSGTSMSAPHVSGALALAWSYNTSMSNAALRARATSSSVDLGSAGRDSAYGWGLVDAKCLMSQTPHVPRSVKATAGPGAGQIRVQWTKPVYDCRSSISAYRIYRASSGGSYSLVGTVSGSSRSFTDSGLGNGVTRYYRVRAVNGFGASLYSKAASARTFKPPSAPRNVTATSGPGVLEITVSWDVPLDDGGTPITGYRVYRSTEASGSYSQKASLGATARSWTDSSPELGITYYYRVSAVNKAGVGPRSTHACAKGFPLVVVC